MPLNKTAAAYAPEPGSLAGRVIDLVARNQDEEWTTRDLATKLDAVSSSVQALLHAPMSHGLVAFERAEDGSGKVWRAGPNLRDWLALRAQPAATAQTQPQAAGAGAGAAPPPPRRGLIDPFAVVIRSNVPVPTIAQSHAVTSPYKVLWERMKVGDCVELPMRQADSLVAFVRKNKHPHTVRKTAIGSKTIWRNA